VKDGITACDSDFHVNHRILLHAANLQYGTDGFTSPPMEGMLWIFSPEKSDGFGRGRTLVYQRPACHRNSYLRTTIHRDISNLTVSLAPSNNVSRLPNILLYLKICHVLTVVLDYLQTTSQDEIECSETSVHKIQTPRNQPKERKQLQLIYLNLKSVRPAV
jgi:hypothetical protein